MKLSKKAKELMKDGEDFQVREEICEELKKIIDKSNKGEISLADLIERLDKISHEVKAKIHNHWGNKN